MIIKWHKLKSLDDLNNLRLPFFLRTKQGEIYSVGDLIYKDKILIDGTYAESIWDTDLKNFIDYGIIADSSEKDPVFTALGKWFRQQNCKMFETCKADLELGGAYRLKFVCKCFEEILKDEEE